MRHDAARGVLLDIVRAGNRLVAVGERGVVVCSDDNGDSWHQADVPTSVSLTAVAFPTPLKGWAVGHGGVVLHSDDGGRTWRSQLDGMIAARLAYAAAEAKARGAGPENKEKMQRRLAKAQRLVDDGPDKPFLDVCFVDGRKGYIVGAYNLAFHTQDAGQSWQPCMDRLDNPRELHLYAIQVVGQSVYIAGEQGLFLRSLDGGLTFQRLATPYQGTWFALAADSTGMVVLAGLRGNAYRSTDRGRTFAPIPIPMPASLNTLMQDDDGTLYFGNQAGFVLAGRDRGQRFAPLDAPRLPPVAALIPIDANTIMTVGWGGAITVSTPPTDNPGGRP
jgi:photosystem II stability/assembly factor-like uncharacterized protein